MIKAYFIDLDGTALDIRKKGKWTISDENIKAVKKISKKSLVVISTGRPKHEFNKEKKMMGIKYTIARNGAFICNEEGEVIDYKPMDKNAGNKLIEFLKNKKIFAKINDEQIIYRKNLIASIIAKKYNSKNWSWKKFTEPKNYEKILILSASKNKIQKIKKQIEDEFSGFNLSTSGHGFVLEVTDIKATKGLAALKILKMNNINPANAAHIGDSMNDASAMDVLGYGITFKNSDRSLLNHASHIGPEHKHAGLAKILDGKYLKNELGVKNDKNKR